MTSKRQQRAARPKLAARWLGLSALLAAVASLLTLAACQTPQVNTNLVPVDVGVSRTTALSQSNVERGQSLLDVSIVLFQHETDALTESETRLHNAERLFSLLFKEVLDQSGLGSSSGIARARCWLGARGEGGFCTRTPQLRLRLICGTRAGPYGSIKRPFSALARKIT